MKNSSEYVVADAKGGFSDAMPYRKAQAVAKEWNALGFGPCMLEKCLDDESAFDEGVLDNLTESAN